MERNVNKDLNEEIRKEQKVQVLFALDSAEDQIRHMKCLLDQKEIRCKSWEQAIEIIKDGKKALERI